mgnify:CR=1 FL=1
MEIWEEFTNDVIKYVSENNNKCVFVLLGAFAKAKKTFITNKKRIVEGVHPSGLSAHKGFFGSGIFKKIEELFHADGTADLRVNVLSFGYKYGIPVDADLVMDCRFIPNPHWIPELRPLTGLDTPVSEKVLGSEGVADFVQSYVSVVQKMIPGYFRFDG